jgi:hypothetical protein
MITLSDEHLENLRAIERQYYYEDLAEFFAQREPHLFATLSAEEQIYFAKASEMRAREAGLTSTPAIYAWADCAILLGAMFHADPYYAPLSRIFASASPFNEPERINEAQEWLTEYLPKAKGQNGEAALASFEKLSGFALSGSDISQYQLPHGQDIEAHQMHLVGTMFPTLAVAHAESETRARVEMLLNQARRYYGVTGIWHLSYYTMLGFACGVGLDHDECLPWVGRRLSRCAELGPEATITLLSQRARVWFDHVAINAEKPQ